MKVEHIGPRRSVLARAIAAAFVLAASSAVESAAIYPLGTLPASAAFRLEGALAGSRSGYSVAAAGDVNGDGIDDFLIGACERCELDPGPAATAGQAWVVFGRAAGFPASVSLASLDGTTGFRLDGAVLDDRAGFAVAGGADVNGDAIDDLVIGAPRSDVAAADAGSTYVVFGRAVTAPFPATLALAALDGNTGFRIDGVAAGDRSGSAVAMLGDLDGNGIADLAIGASKADPNGDASGSAFVVYGRATAFPAALALSALDGNNGFRINGAGAGDEAGSALAAAGDVNEDGRADFVLGAPFTDPLVDLGGASYVVFGRAATAPFAATLELSTLDGNNGFRLEGANNNDRSGSSVAGGGDVNGDDIDDLFIGAFAADPGSINAAGSTYVVFGRSTAFTASIPLSGLDGTTGFRIDGAAAGDVAGRAVSAGDINGDGFDDVAIGADLADAGGAESGNAYLVFGRAGPFPATLGLATLDGSNGVRFDGAAAFDHTGFALARAGDVDDDGITDLVIGADGNDAGGANAGRSYVVRGNAAPLRSGTGSIDAGSVLEDQGAAPGTRIDALLGPVYLDAEPFAGAAITVSPSTATGVWQFSIDGGMNWGAVPAGLSASSALVLAPDVQVRFVPVLNFSGPSVGLVLRMWDGADGYTPGAGRNISTSIGSLGGFSNDANAVPLVATVAPVNDAPSFAADDPPPAVANGSEVVVAGWALFSAGPASESGQAVDAYLAGNVSNPGLFAQPPVVDPNGTLRYTPLTGVTGTSTFTVRVRDNGGTANGGVDLSPIQTFTINLVNALDPIFKDEFE